jgi:hypothetical protein
MTQVLHLANGKTLLEKLESSDGRIAQLLAADVPAGQIVEDLYLSALSRRPTAEERVPLTAVIVEAPENEKRSAIEDVYWSVLTSREFLFQH